LAPDLEAFFADHDRVDQLAQPLRLPSPPASRGTVPDDGACAYRKRHRPAGFGGKSVRRRWGRLASRGGVADRFLYGW
jgi:hypothetical protein